MLLSHGDELEEAEASEEITPQSKATVTNGIPPAANTTTIDNKRQTGDSSVYKYYFGASGYYNVALTLGMTAASAFCTVYSSKSLPETPGRNTS